MAGEFERYNQAVLAEQQLIQQEQEAQQIIASERLKTQQQKKQVKKAARQQVLETGMVDPTEVRAAKETISKREMQLSAVEAEFAAEKQKISQKKSKIKTHFLVTPGINLCGHFQDPLMTGGVCRNLHGRKFLHNSIKETTLPPGRLV